MSFGVGCYDGMLCLERRFMFVGEVLMMLMFFCFR